MRIRTTSALTQGDAREIAETVKYLPMKPDTWAPHVTVAAIVERDGRFLVIEEHTSAGLRINQPAGHLEAGETLVEAVIRETLEETAHRFEPEALVGAYMTHFARPGRASRICGSRSAARRRAK